MRSRITSVDVSPLLHRCSVLPRLLAPPVLPDRFSERLLTSISAGCKHIAHVRISFFFSIGFFFGVQD